MTPERLTEIEIRIVKNQSAPDLADLALELARALRATLPAPAPVAPSVPELIAGDALPPPRAETEKAGEEPEEKRGFFGKKLKK